MSAITLRCVPRFTLHRDDARRPLGETLDRLDEHVDGNDHFEFWVFPYTRTALTRTCRRSDEAPSPSPAWRRRLHEDVLENRAARARLPRRPRRRRARCRGSTGSSPSAMSGSRVEDDSHKVFATQRRVRFNEMEYAIPRAHAREAVERALDAIERPRLPITFPLEVRFAAGDDALLSTAHERETCYIAVHQYRGMEFETCFRAIEAIMDDYGGRPHWGKRHYQTAATLRRALPRLGALPGGPRAARSAAARSRTTTRAACSARSPRVRRGDLVCGEETLDPDLLEQRVLRRAERRHRREVAQREPVLLERHREDGRRRVSRIGQPPRRRDSRLRERLIAQRERVGIGHAADRLAVHRWISASATASQFVTSGRNPSGANISRITFAGAARSVPAASRRSGRAAALPSTTFQCRSITTAGYGSCAASIRSKAARTCAAWSPSSPASRYSGA